MDQAAVSRAAQSSAVSCSTSEFPGSAVEAVSTDTSAARLVAPNGRMGACMRHANGQHRAAAPMGIQTTAMMGWKGFLRSFQASRQAQRGNGLAAARRTACTPPACR
jgi:hypothetical protein